MNCPFCDVDETITRKVFDNGKVMVALSNPRIKEGHLLVIPKKHVEKLSEMSREERNELFEVAVNFQEKILSKYADGCDISQHYRPFIPQSNLKVNHLHIHLRPRDNEDELYKKSQIFEKDLFAFLTEEEINKFRNLLSDG